MSAHPRAPFLNCFSSRLMGALQFSEGHFTTCTYFRHFFTFAPSICSKTLLIVLSLIFFIRVRPGNLKFKVSPQETTLLTANEKYFRPNRLFCTCFIRVHIISVCGKACVYFQLPGLNFGRLFVREIVSVGPRL